MSGPPSEFHRPIGQRRSGHPSTDTNLPCSTSDSRRLPSLNHSQQTPTTTESCMKLQPIPNLPFKLGCAKAIGNHCPRIHIPTLSSSIWSRDSLGIFQERATEAPRRSLLPRLVKVKLSGARQHSYPYQPSYLHINTVVHQDGIYLRR